MTKPENPLNGDPGFSYGGQLTSTLGFPWAGCVAWTASAPSFAGVLSSISHSSPCPQEKSWHSAVSASVVASTGYKPSGSRTFTGAL